MDIQYIGLTSVCYLIIGSQLVGCGKKKKLGFQVLLHYVFNWVAISLTGELQLPIY